MPVCWSWISVVASIYTSSEGADSRQHVSKHRPFRRRDCARKPAHEERKNEVYCGQHARAQAPVLSDGNMAPGSLHIFEPRWASALILMSTISDIRHLLLRCWKKICWTENCHSNIRRVLISTSESTLIFDIKTLNYRPGEIEPTYLFSQASTLPFSHYGWSMVTGMLDKSSFRYPIMSYSALFSPISEVPISGSVIVLIMDIRLRAHLCIWKRTRVHIRQDVSTHHYYILYILFPAKQHQKALLLVE